MNAPDRLRAYLGETIPQGGSDADTLFTDAAIEDIISVAPTFRTTQRSLWAAAAEGWDRKAGLFAEMVDNQTGGTNRLNSQMYDHAVKEAERYRQLAYGRRTASTGRIVRPGTTIR